jgi:hypothetical protein
MQAKKLSSFWARVSLVTLFLLVSGLLFGQSDRGTITGTVSDQAGALVPNAKVTARSPENGGVFETVTTATGNYTLPELPGGLYELSVEAAGFSKYVQEGIHIQVVQTARIDVVLQVGSTSQSMTVTADATLLRTESAEQSATVNGDMVNDLPLSFTNNPRSPIGFAGITPGATNITGSNIQMHVNGAPDNTYRTLVDGQDITSGIDPSHLSETQPSVESLQQVSLQSSNFAAEFGSVTGGLVNLTSRSGTDQYHGSGYEYFVNRVLNAGQAYTNNGTGGLVNPFIRNNDWGGTIGGPVRIPKIYNGKNKTFFFFNFEQYKTFNFINGTPLETVPTAAYRAGNFAGALTGRTLGTDPTGAAIMENVIYDPATNFAASNGSIVRTPFPGNIIPASRIDTAAAAIQALIPMPLTSGLVNNFAPTDKTDRGKTMPSVKIDEYISPKSKLSFYWGDWIQNMNKNVGDGLPFPISNARVYKDRNQTARLTLDQTVSPTFLVHVGLGDMHYNHHDSTPQSVLDYNASGLLGLGGDATGFPQITGLTSSQGGFLFTNSSGGTTSTVGPTNAGVYHNDKPTAVASATWVHGNHTYKAGAEGRKDIWTDVEQVGTTGIYNVLASETGLPYLQTTSLSGGEVGFPYASFLLGAIDNATVRNEQDPQLRKHAVGLYLQDTWKVTRKLTMDYGVRWDYQTAATELHDRWSMFGPSVANPSAGGLLGGTIYEGSGPGGCNCNFTSSYPYALGPRLGIAYQLDSKTVLRGGWGLIYGTTATTGYTTNTAISGVGWNTLSFSNGNYGTPSVQLHNGLTFTQAQLNAAPYSPGLFPSPGQINSPPYYIDRAGGRPPRINQWNISVQRQFTANLVLEAAFVGNTGVWLRSDSMEALNNGTLARIAAAGLNINSASDYALLTSPWNSAAVQARGFKAPYAGYPTGLTLAQTLRPYPQFGSIPTDWAAQGNSWYNALQTKLTKRMSHGLDLTAAFTWSQEIQLGATSGTAGAPAVNDILNRDQNKYISADSQPLVLAMGYTYRVPAIGTSSRLLRDALRDWTYSGMLRYASGLPIESPLATNNLSTVLFTGTFADRVPGVPLFTADLNCHCVNPNKQFVLNPAAWTEPANGQWGTAAAYYNDYRYQRRPIEQMAFGRTFRLREGMTLQFRAEAYNVFNRTEMNNPTSTNALATQTVNAQGVPTAGFGWINTGSLFSSPRNAQLVARFQF